LALLGRRPPPRVDGLVIPASEKPAQNRKWRILLVANLFEMKATLLPKLHSARE
jgi:hypothetical protein